MTAEELWLLCKAMWEPIQLALLWALAMLVIGAVNSLRNRQVLTRRFRHYVLQVVHDRERREKKVAYRNRRPWQAMAFFIILAALSALLVSLP